MLPVVSWKHLPAIALLVASALILAAVRPGIARQAAKVKNRDDSYALPPTSTLTAVSMGYRQALADLIWAHVLVTQGLRGSERRPFNHLTEYLTAINTLDPKFREPYKYADTLLTFQMNDPDKVDNVRSARRILERGLRELPNDAELWVNYGEFLAYTGPSALTDPAEQDQWRADGAVALMHAGQLGSKDETVMWHSVAAVGLLSGKEAEREALIHFLERVYALTEDPELRDHVSRRLQQLAVNRQESRLMAQRRAFEELWRPLSFVSRTQLRVIGPPRDTWRCAGPLREGLQADDCARDWVAWSKGVLPQP